MANFKPISKVPELKDFCKEDINNVGVTKSGELYSFDFESDKAQVISVNEASERLDLPLDIIAKIAKSGGHFVIPKKVIIQEETDEHGEKKDEEDGEVQDQIDGKNSEGKEKVVVEPESEEVIVFEIPKEFIEEIGKLFEEFAVVFKKELQDVKDELQKTKDELKELRSQILL